MVKLREIEATKDLNKRHEMCQQWGQERGFNHSYPGLSVMRYIEALEEKLDIAMLALRSIAVPALGGKAQQYTAQAAIQEIEKQASDERETNP